jgi:hypothetical protein
VIDPVSDPAITLAFHDRETGLNGQERALQVDGQDAVPLGFRDVFDQVQRIDPGDLRQDIDAPMAGHGCLGQALHIGAAGYIRARVLSAPRKLRDNVAA